MRQSTLSPLQYRIKHGWNDYSYVIQHLSCFHSDSKKWFVRFGDSTMICDPSRSDYVKFWIYTPIAELGYESPEDALAAFDAAMAVRYRAIEKHNEDVE